MGPGVGRWGRERYVTNRPGPDFDQMGPAWGWGKERLYILKEE
jgi:hypothetical protein